MQTTLAILGVILSFAIPIWVYSGKGPEGGLRALTWMGVGLLVTLIVVILI